MTGPLPPLLCVADVQRRYRLDDPRAARAIMRAAGAIKAAGRLYVRSDDLDSYEHGQADATRRAQRPQARSRASGQGRSTTTRTPATKEPLKPGWWRTDAS